MGWPRHRSVNSASQTILSHMRTISATGKTKVGGKLHLYSFAKFVLPVECEKHMYAPTDQSLPQRNMTNIERRSLFELVQKLRPVAHGMLTD